MRSRHVARAAASASSTTARSEWNRSPTSKARRTPSLMEKTYSPADIEQRWYAQWESSGAFAPRSDPAAAPFCIMIPPPNVTGTLHMGHAFQDTIMDALTRYHRMRGEAVLWQPGTDHAGIATQMLVERQLNSEGRQRSDLTREQFIERVWQWKTPVGRQHRPAAAQARRLRGLVARSLHDGSGPLGHGHGSVCAPARGSAHLPGPAAGQLGSGVAHGAVGSGGHQRRREWIALVPALPVERRRQLRWWSPPRGRRR